MYKAICENPENKLGEKGYLKKKSFKTPFSFQTSVMDN